MKKTLLLLASAALLLVGCQKEQIAEKNVGGEGLQTVSFTVGVESAATKAVADEDGKAANINHWIMQVLDSDGEFYNYQEDNGEVGAKTHTFNVPLIKGQTYDVLFWADTKGNYVVNDLRNVKRADAVALTANRDDLDAFSAVVEDFATTVATNQTVTLKRPFAQLNVVFTDLAKLYATMGNDTEYGKFVPTNFVAEAKVPTTFNVLTQEAGAPAETALEMKAATNYKDNYAAHAEKATLYMDYILATKGSKDVVDIDFSFISKGVEIAHEFTAIPFQRNYRTNIIGEFMSANAQWKVVVDPNWDGEYDKEYEAEGSVAAAIEALKASKTAVEIVSPEDYATPIAMPAQTDGKDISIKVSGVSGKEMTFNLAEGAQGPANLYITTDAQDLTIDLPNTHAEVNGGTYQNVTATTSATTLVVGKEVTINTLTINGGNAAIYGLVNTINKQASTVVDFYVSAAAGLRSVAEKISAAPGGKDFYGKVFLTADIDLDNEEWTPIAAFQKPLAIDGQGYTIKNLKVTESAAAYIGFIGTACGLTVKNLNFDTVILSYPSTVGENARGGVIAGQVYGATIENCSVKNVDITACQKVGGLLGYIEGNTNVPHIIKNCSVENVSIKSNDPAKILQHGAGGFIGHISLSNNPLVSISSCSVKDVTIADFGTEYSIQLVPHAFIGNVCNNHTGTEVADITSHSVVLSNNSISGTNTVLPTCMYSSDYFGWAGNAEERATWKGGIYIDGEAWTPDYPVKNVTTGKGYISLKDAVDAASAGEEIEILKAGTYAVPNIPKNITITGEGDVNENGVVFNCVGSGSIASISNGATFKNVTMNFGQSGYHGFQGAGHIVMDECTLNGLFFSYGDMTFNECIFNQENEEYNMWTYAGDITYDGCTFNSKGKFLNIYRESATEYDVVAKDCVFNTSKASKAALNIKETCNAIFLKYNVTITNCSCNDTQNTLENKDDGTLYRVSPIWQVDDRKAGETGINVTVDGLKVYPFCSKDADGNYHIVNAAGLLQFHDLYAAGKVAYTAKVYLENDIDFTGKTWTVCDWHADTNKKGFALFDGQNHAIKNFTVDGQGMFSRWAGGATPYFKDIVFDGAKNVTSSLNVSLFCGQVYQNAKIENVTIKNSQIEGTYKVAPFVGTVYDENAGRTVTLTLKDCKVENTTVRGTAYDFDICGMVAWVNESGDNDKITFEGNNVVKDVTLYIPKVTYNMCAKIYHNGETAYDEATNVTVTNVNVVNGQ